MRSDKGKKKGKNKQGKFAILLNRIKEYIIIHKDEIILIAPFVLMHVYIGIMALSVNYNFYNFFAPLLFSISWVVLWMGLCLNVRKILGKVLYIIFTGVFAILFLVNGVYRSMMSNFFDFSLMESASEGTPYILDALKNCNILVYLAFISIIVSIVIGVRHYPKKDAWNLKGVGITLIAFVLLHTIAPITLGKANTNLTWSNWRNARNIYNAYNDANKSIKVSGFYEFEIRNFYVTFLKSEGELKKEDLEFLEEAFSENMSSKNKYTGLLKNKNLIIVQLEGMDNWIVNEEDTPTIYKMMNEGINFTNHFSFYNGGGSTFNSEFAINTGFVTPYSYTRNAYSFNKNAFPYSLANIFKDMDYRVNVFHMNSGEYYSRKINYKNWGYDNYNGLKDLKTYEDDSYTLDRELIMNDEFNDLMFGEEGKFVNYIITYSGHLPFSNTKGVCKMLYEEDHMYEKDHEFEPMSEEECVRRQNRETDDMMALLLDDLKAKNLLDSTAIVVATDHYLYTLEDQSTLAKYKETSNNLINKTPLFVWYKGVKSVKVKSVTSQLDILPTILNLYGVKYNTNNYIGHDALQNNYKGMVFFNDYSWYDGNVYVENGVVTNKKNISFDDLEEKNYEVTYATKKNDLALKYNYFGLKKEVNDD